MASVASNVALLACSTPRGSGRRFDGGILRNVVDEKVQVAVIIDVSVSRGDVQGQTPPFTVLQPLYKTL